MILSIKKDDSLNPSSSLKVLWKPLTIDFSWIYCTIIIISLSPLPSFPKTEIIIVYLLNLYYISSSSIIDCSFSEISFES